MRNATKLASRISKPPSTNSQQHEHHDKLPLLSDSLVHFVCSQGGTASARLACERTAPLGTPHLEFWVELWRTNVRRFVSDEKLKWQFFYGGLALFLSGACFYYPSVLICTKAPVVNIKERALLEAREFPAFVHQKHTSERLNIFRAELVGLLASNPIGLQRATAIRKWCRQQQIAGWSANDDASTDPLVLVRRQQQGIPGTCRRFAYVFAGALLAGGMESRFVGAASGLHDADECHVFVEVWIPQLNHWVAMDSMNNVTYGIDGEPASLLQLYDAANTGRLKHITFERDGSTTEPAPSIDYLGRTCHHLIYSTNNAYFDGYHVGFGGPKRLTFAHFSDYGFGNYPEQLKNLLLAGGCSALIASLCFGVGVIWRVAMLIRTTSTQAYRFGSPVLTPDRR